MPAAHSGLRKRSTARRWKRTLRRCAPLIGIPLLFIMLALSMELLEYQPIESPHVTQPVSFENKQMIGRVFGVRPKANSESIQKVLRVESARDSQLEAPAKRSERLVPGDARATRPLR